MSKKPADLSLFQLYDELVRVQGPKALSCIARAAVFDSRLSSQHVFVLLLVSSYAGANGDRLCLASRAKLAALAKVQPAAVDRIFDHLERTLDQEGQPYLSRENRKADDGRKTTNVIRPNRHYVLPFEYFQVGRHRRIVRGVLIPKEKDQCIDPQRKGSVALIPKEKDQCIDPLVASRQGSEVLIPIRKGSVHSVEPSDLNHDLDPLTTRSTTTTVATKPVVVVVDSELIQKLKDKKVAAKDARRLAETYPERCAEKLALLDQLLAAGCALGNVPGFLRRAIEEDYQPPAPESSARAAAPAARPKRGRTTSWEAQLVDFERRQKAEQAAVEVAQ